jgi:alpha-ribazole phosphatase
MTNWHQPDALTSRLVFVRHGEPDESVRNRCYGRLDVDLSPRGRAQMRRTCRALLAAPIAAVYCSPRRRALESANILTAKRDAPVTICDSLREIDFGDFEGLAYADIAARFPALYAEWMAAPTAVAFPGGEAFADMVRRVAGALDAIRAAHRAQTIAIVSHGGVNRIALTSALGLDPAHMFRLDQAYASVTVIDYFGDTPLVRVVNAEPAMRC